MEEVRLIGLDIAKTTFQAYGVTAYGGVAFRKKRARRKVLEFLSQQPACGQPPLRCGCGHQKTKPRRV